MSFISTAGIFIVNSGEVSFAADFLSKPLRINNLQFDRNRKILSGILENNREIQFMIRKKQLSQVEKLLSLVS